MQEPAVKALTRFGQDKVDRVGEVSGYMVRFARRRLIVFEDVCIDPGADEYVRASRRAGGLHVGEGVAYQVSLCGIKPIVFLRRHDEAGFGFSAGAIIGKQVRAVVKPFYHAATVLIYEILQSRCYGIENGLGDEALADTPLVRNDYDTVTRLVQAGNGIGCAGQQAYHVRRCHVAVSDRLIDNTVPIEQDVLFV